MFRQTCTAALLALAAIGSSTAVAADGRNASGGGRQITSSVDTRPGLVASRIGRAVQNLLIAGVNAGKAAVDLQNTRADYNRSLQLLDKKSPRVSLFECPDLETAAKMCRLTSIARSRA